MNSGLTELEKRTLIYLNFRGEASEEQITMVRKAIDEVKSVARPVFTVKYYKIAECPIVFFDSPPKDEIHQMVYENLNPPVAINTNDFKVYDNSSIGLISKRTHNTEHNHPDLVGTLDKAKFVLNKDAIEKDDPQDRPVERTILQGPYDDIFGKLVNLYETDYYIERITKVLYLFHKSLVK